RSAHAFTPIPSDNRRSSRGREIVCAWTRMRPNPRCRWASLYHGGRMTNVTAEIGSAPSSARIDYYRVGPEAMRAMAALERFVHASGLESRLVELVKLRASYLNGCAYCVDVHTKDARVAGET